MVMEKLHELHSPHCSSSSSAESNLHPLDVGAEEWERAERRVDEVLFMIQPTVMSERRRKEIIEYIQILVGSSYGIKVFPLGSVPLKTYIPDGDIDLTAVCQLDTELALSFLCSLLQNEATTNHQIQVRDVHVVPAEVKVIKCFVEGICMDISVNQIDGLCALSFLEQVDQLIGKDHLYKRSIILVKAWCFYEGRILGAKDGLISTYALEIMVAHIINLFHSSLHSPLAVLYKFLGYYRQFDWTKHCVAIDGLVHISSLPEVVVTPPDNSDDMLLSTEFLQKCRQTYSHSTGVNQTEGRHFNLKFLNIVDPLRNDNNAGRSVNTASFNRIKSAFKLATEKLKATFDSPVEEVTKGIDTIFKTTLWRNGGEIRPDGVPVPEKTEKLSHDNENVLSGIRYGLWLHDFGIYQGCKDPTFPEMWDGRYDMNTLFQVNENLAEHYFGVNNVPIHGTARSRGTGTFFPQLVYEKDIPFEQARRREKAVEFEPTQSSEEVPESVKMVMEEFADLEIVRLGDETEFPPLQGK